MATAIRKHLRDFIAVVGLALIALVIGWIIVQQERLRVPVLEERPLSHSPSPENSSSAKCGSEPGVRAAI
jgi:hypothetical protein